jgi:hypothetical protein
MLKMTKEKVLELFKGLQGVANLSGVKFSYAVAKNINLLKSEIEALDKALEPYDKLRIELVKKYAKKDKNGREVVMGNNYVIDDRKAFSDELKELQDGNQDYQDYLELLKGELEIKLHQISQSDVPEAITTQQMIDIVDIIKED